MKSVATHEIMIIATWNKAMDCTVEPEVPNNGSVRTEQNIKEEHGIEKRIEIHRWRFIKRIEKDDRMIA